MADKRATRKTRTDVFAPPSPDSVVGQHYYYLTQRPWPSLLFVLPMLLAFEVGIYVRQDGVPGGGSQLVAAFLIERVITEIGAGRFGYIFPALALVAILLAVHLVARHPWKFDLVALPGMLGESLIWAIPLLVFNRVLYTALIAGGAALPNQWLDQIIRSLGAGLYEELVFRLICIAGLDILLINIFKFPRSASRVFAVLASAALFAAQHHPPLGADPFELTDFLFRTAAGIYLACLFLFRGFGIAAGCHVFYNIIVVTTAAAQG
ncbi:MAG TPA: CPBP family intramembrane glutamic endopeptidase [Phycisphaerae bacterium]|nr:CPBP family intramembrane glutamic endopeptidase [Phycisphaerae bacterium]